MTAAPAHKTDANPLDAATGGYSNCLPRPADRPARGAVPRKRAILVAGMHRSGTSALTRVLNLLGAELPSDLMPAASTNPTGPWEAIELVALNGRLPDEA